MVETPIYPSREVTLAEVKALLEREREDRGELTYEQKLAFEQANMFSKLSPDDAIELVGKLQEIDRLSGTHAIKIADVAPTHPDDVKAIFSKDRYTPDDAEIDKIINLVREYL